MLEDDDPYGDDVIERSLALYVSRDLSWGNWRPSRGARPSALYNVEWGYDEFGLDDLATLADLDARRRHFEFKSWFRGAEVANLERALIDLGIIARLTSAPTLMS